MSFVVRHVMKKLEANRGLEYHKMILHYAGFGEPTPRLNLKYILPRVTLLVMIVFVYICSPVQAFRRYGYTTAFFQPLHFVFVTSMPMMKGGYFLFKYKKVNQLTVQLEQVIERNQLGTKYELQILKKTQAWINIGVLLVIFYYITVTIFAIGVLPYLFYSRQFYTRIWISYDLYASPNFEILLLLQSLIVFSLNWCIAVDAFIMALLIQTVGQLEILQHNIRNIRQLSMETVRERKAGRLVLTCTTKLFEVGEARQKDEYQTFISTDRLYRRNDQRGLTISKLDPDHDKEIRENCIKPTASMFTVDEMERSMTDVKNVDIGREDSVVIDQVSDIDREEIIRTNEEVAMEMKRRLRQCNKHHLEICSFVVEFEPTFSYILSHQLMCNVIPTVIIILSVKEVDAMTIVGVGSFFLVWACTAELFLYCWLANKVTTESSNVREAVYGMDWFDCSESFKRSMRIIMSRANQPIVINIAGYIPLSLETFKSVIHLAWSYYTALSNTISR